MHPKRIQRKFDRQTNFPGHHATTLEPWFSGDTHFDARHELLFDLLLDAYTNLGKPRKKSAPPIASHYTLQADGDSAGELRPKRGLKAALAFWDDAFPGIAYSPLQDDASGDISGRCRPRGWRCWTSIRSYGMHLRYSMGWCVPQWHFR